MATKKTPENQTSWVIGHIDPLHGIDQLRTALFDFYTVDKPSQQQYLEPSYEEVLHDPTKLSGMAAAVARIKQAIKLKQKIAVYGDYDIDGITATALVCEVLRKLGAEAEPYIPDRFEEGYGLNSEALSSIKASGVDLVVTVDCGITGAEQVAEAAKAGLDIIITDHHTVPDELPKRAVALINPLLPGDEYQFKSLAGVGVAFKLACALIEAYPGVYKLGHEKWLLDLVALGTVCDVVPLKGENRALVQFGLKVLAKSPRLGLQALARVSGVELSAIKASDLGFRFGPRLNAAGRLEHASKALELLMTANHARAEELAQNLNELNRERQQDTIRIFESANAMAAEYESDPMLVLAHEDWSHGVVGLVASRVSEARHKPTILLQVLGDKAKGSARSVGGFNIIEAISSCSDLLERFGGHAFAAGMTLQTKDVPNFRQQLNEYIAKHASEGIGPRELVIVGELAPELLTTEAAKAVGGFEPFSNGNAEPVFMAKGKVTKLRPVGSDLSHLQLTLNFGKAELGAIAFGAAKKWPWLELDAEVELAFRLDINVWQGSERLQLQVVDVRVT